MQPEQLSVRRPRASRCPREVLEQGQRVAAEVGEPAGARGARQVAHAAELGQRPWRVSRTHTGVGAPPCAQNGIPAWALGTSLAASPALERRPCDPERPCAAASAPGEAGPWALAGERAGSQPGAPRLPQGCTLAGATSLSDSGSLGLSSSLPVFSTPLPSLCYFGIPPTHFFFFFLRSKIHRLTFDPGEEGKGSGRRRSSWRAKEGMSVREWGVCMMFARVVPRPPVVAPVPVLTVTFLFCFSVCTLNFFFVNNRNSSAPVPTAASNHGDPPNSSDLIPLDSLS